MTGRLFIGCAIWAFDGWTGNFYPPKLPAAKRLYEYGRRLTCCEVNSTFYALPKGETVDKWVADTPDHFRFSPKFPKLITHSAGLIDAEADTSAFLELLTHFGGKLGAAMLQLPPAFSPDRLDILEDYLHTLPDDLSVAVEVRHLDWFTPENDRLLNEMLASVGNCGRVVFDGRPALTSDSPDALSAQEKKPDVPVVMIATRREVLIRYISSPVIAENDPYFEAWTPQLMDWIAADHDVHFFTHCPDEVQSPTLARMLFHRVRDGLTERGIHIDPLPWDALDTASTDDPGGEQLTLF